MEDLGQHLGQSLQGRVCLIGLGNVDYGDDGFGVRLAEQLIDAGLADVMVVGTTPERFLGRIEQRRFDHVVFVDTVDSGSEPGSVIFLDSAQMAARFPQFSTHKISFSVLADFVEASGTTKAWLLGVQPESQRPADPHAKDQPLTPTVRRTLEALCELLLSVLGEQSVPRSGAASPSEQCLTSSEEGPNA